MSDRRLRYERAEGVARLTIDRPEACKALDLATMQEVLDVANRCSSDKSVRALVLSGAGDKAFCAGGDGQTADAREGLRAFVDKRKPLFRGRS